MKLIRHLCILASTLSITSYALAGQIPEGTFGQTSTSAGGDCPTCEIKISKPAPHILKISSNNGWIGYAYYTQQDDKYRGAFEWQSGKGGAYDNVVFLIDLVYEGQTITLNAKSNPLNMSITYRKK